MTLLDPRPARALTDREVAKMVCSQLGMALDFGTDPETGGRALAWCANNWPEIRAEMVKLHAAIKAGDAAPEGS